MRSSLKLVLAGLGAGAALAFVACQDIVGLDDFHKCDVEITCTTDASSDAFVDASDAGASDAFTLPDGVSEASSWARWRMDNAPSEVATGAPDASLARFDASTPLYFDEVNGNQWCTQKIGKAANVTDAASFCASLGCRLPTRIEIISLLDSTQQGKPFITPPFVPFVLDAGVDSLWTSSYMRPIGDGGIQFWFAGLQTGDMTTSTASNVGVLCMK